MATRDLLVRLRADTGQYKAEMTQAGRVTDDMTRSTGRQDSAMGRAFGSLRSMQAQMLAVGVAAGVVVRGIQQTVEAASRLEQSVGATDAVFKDASGAIGEFAADSAQSVGSAESEFRELATVTGASLKNMGFAVDEAAEKSVGLVQIGADLSATFGGTTKDAVMALTAAFRGEADPAEKYGLRLQAGAVTAKALEMGLADTAKEVDKNDKALATLALITEQTTDITGQFARESDTLAGSQARANAEFENAKAALGEKLLPTLTAATQQFANLAEVVSDPSWQALSDTIEQGLSNQIRTLTFGLIDVTGAFDGVTDAEKNAAIEAAGASEKWKVVNGELVDLTVTTNGAAEASRIHAERIATEDQAFQDLSGTLRAQTDPLFAVLNASNGLATAQAAVAAAVVANSDAIDTNNVSAEEMNRLNLNAAEAAATFEQKQIDLAYAVSTGSVNLDTAKATLARWVEQGYLTQGQADLMGAAFVAAAGKALTIPGAVEQSAIQSRKVIIDQLGNVTVTVNARVVSHGVPSWQTWGGGAADGAVIDYFGNGSENHVAQIAPAGAWRMWAEPETGGEAYIPLSMSKRARSAAILSDVADRFGFQLLANASGAINLAHWWQAAYNPMDALPSAELVGTGAAGPALSAGIGWQAMWAALQAAGLGARLHSAYRPGAITATGNKSMHGMGRAIDVSPSMAIFNWIKSNYGGSKEIIYSPAGGQQVHNGQNHMYGEPTRSMHFCVDLGTEILTRRGWLTHDQLRVGDETPGFNFRTLCAEWTPITHVNVFNAAEVVETGNNRGWTVRTTPNHRWVAWSRSKGYHTTTTEERTHASWVVAAPMVDGPGVDLTDEEAELLGWLITDGSQWEADERCTFEGCTNPARAKGLCGSHREQQRLGKTLRPLRGYPRGAKPDFSVFVWQTKPAGVARIGEILGDDGTWNGKGYRLRDTYARDLLDRARLSHIKNADELRSLIFDMTARQRQAMLVGVIGGDGGCTNPSGASGIRIHGDAGPLLDVEAILVYLCGHRTRVYKRGMPDDIDGWGTQEGRTYRRNGVPMMISLGRPHVSTAARDRRPVGVMPVWCPTTELGSWTMRSGDDVMLTMNSHVHWGLNQGGILGGGGGGVAQKVHETINVVLTDGSVIAETQRQYDRYNTGR